VKVNGFLNGTSSPADGSPTTLKEKSKLEVAEGGKSGSPVKLNGEGHVDGDEHAKPSVKVIEESVPPVVATDETVVVVNGDGKVVEEVTETLVSILLVDYGYHGS
jgi:hypothetical protein